ncbi:MAG: hypothetical protein Ct9H90mP4_03170 [Gammaproteobacteria bacterium]|nr:MAG: hypothetical protein Ct9H90mP4_03170 [Gammaproteobacteria bacterium]
MVTTLFPNFCPILGSLFGGLAKGSEEQIENVRRLESDNPLSLPLLLDGMLRKSIIF